MSLPKINTVAKKLTDDEVVVIVKALRDFEPTNKNEEQTKFGALHKFYYEEAARFNYLRERKNA